MKENLCIIGCGWLGKFTGLELSSLFGEVYGSYRSEGTKNELVTLNIEPFQLDLATDDSRVPDDILLSCKTVIITMPPFERQMPEIYGTKLAEIAHQFSSDTKFIFTSSTGVYPITEGFYNEEFECSERHIICYAENQLRKVVQDRLAVLRLGGLFGAQRHPIKFLSGREMATNGAEPIHLIHRNDIVRLIKHVLSGDLFPLLINVSYPLDETKQSYYDHVAKKNALPLPKWGTAEGSKRVISSDKLINLEGFNLIFNPLDFTFA